MPILQAMYECLASGLHIHCLIFLASRTSMASHRMTRTRRASLKLLGTHQHAGQDAGCSLLPMQHPTSSS